MTFAVITHVFICDECVARLVRQLQEPGHSLGQQRHAELDKLFHTPETSTAVVALDRE
jgi:hypothetical protein